MNEEQIEAALDKVRPVLRADDGDIELVGFKNGIVQVRLTGACSACPMAPMTLKQGVEKVVKAEIPEIKEVVTAYQFEEGGC
ncbi:MAG: NifU family protein [Deltaproteobacteria bacterium]|jgi:Fe-S cluster biogenesis protein NfuA|nr:NifU family protein [Deltaproteobacteria bacterium]